MGPQAFVLSLALGTALLAIWCHLRWPSAAPSSFAGAAVRVIAGFALLQVGVLVLEGAAGTSLALAFLAVMGVVVPVLTFAFLGALWMLQVFADRLKGFI